MAPKVQESSVKRDENFSSVTHGFRPGVKRPGEAQPDTFRETLNPWMTQTGGPSAFSNEAQDTFKQENKWPSN